MENKFEIIKDINKFNGFDNKKKIEFMKYFAQVICYNKNYQVLS